jgi:phage baseplate assembly protein W
LSGFNFKSSGTKPSERVNTRAERIALSNQTFGIKTPLTNIKGDHIFDMHTDVLEQLKDNLKNLILTNRGERLGLFNFGANIRELVFEFGSRDDFELEVEKRITEAVATEIPSIEITSVTTIDLTKSQKAELNRQGLAGIDIRVEFSIPSARLTNQNILVNIRPGG